MNEQVLLIDDEQDALTAMVSALGVKKITARVATDPRQAIEDFRANPTDLVIVDYLFPQTPDITGVNIIDELIKIKPFTQFILISGKIDQTWDEESLSQSLRDRIRASRYISKPVNVSKLIEAVQTALQKIDSDAEDWIAIAGHYVEAGTVTPEEVRALNAEISEHIAKAIDEARGEL